MELKVELRRRFVLIFRFESVDKKLNVERCPFTVLPYPGIHADYLGVGDLYSPVENQLPQIDSRAEFLYLVLLPVIAHLVDCRAEQLRRHPVRHLSRRVLNIYHFCSSLPSASIP